MALSKQVSARGISAIISYSYKVFVLFFYVPQSTEDTSIFAILDICFLFLFVLKVSLKTKNLNKIKIIIKIKSHEKIATLLLLCDMSYKMQPGCSQCAYAGMFVIRKTQNYVTFPLPDINSV